MSELKAEKPDYGNWVLKKMISIFGAFGFIFLGLTVVYYMIAILAR